MSKPKRLKNAQIAKLKNEEGRKKDTSQHVFQNKKIDFKLNIQPKHELTPRQKEFLDIILDKKTNIVLLSGRPGTSKTWLSVYAALLCVNNKTHSDILFLRPPIEVGKSLGFLAGDKVTKESVYLTPLYDKLDELLPRPEADLLIKNETIVGTVPNFIRGQSWNGKFIIVDEAQNIDATTLKTIISRFGRYSKLIFCFDPLQADVKGNVEVMRYFDLFNDESSKERGIYSLSFKSEDIVRHPFLSYILDKIEGCYNPPIK